MTGGAQEWRRVGGDGVRVSFFRGVRGDPGGLPIWSGGLAVFGFVQVCSDLFRVVRGALEGLTAKVGAGGDGMAGVAAVLLCFAGVWGCGGG